MPAVMGSAFRGGEPASVFETARLLVRRADVEDAEGIATLWNDPRVMVHVGFPHGLGVERREIERRIAKAEPTIDALWVAVAGSSGMLVGQCRLGRPDAQGISEPDIKLLPAVWNRGYGVELWSGLIDWLFARTACSVVRGTPNVNHEASIRMQEHCGMRRVGEGVFAVPDAMRSRMDPVPHYVYELDRESWAADRPRGGYDDRRLRRDLVTDVERTGPAYRIETERLVLRCWNPSDAARFHAAIIDSIEHLRPWMPWIADEPQSLADRVHRLRRFRGRFDLGEDYVYAIFDRDESRVLGSSGLHARGDEDAREIGYWIRADCVGDGVATETAAALTRVAFEIDGVRRAEIHCDSSNVKSAAVARRLGFIHEATLPRRGTRPDGSPSDSMIWTLHDVDYKASPASRANVRAYDASGESLLP